MVSLIGKETFESTELKWELNKFSEGRMLKSKQKLSASLYLTGSRTGGTWVGLSNEGKDY